MPKRRAAPAHSVFSSPRRVIRASCKSSRRCGENRERPRPRPDGAGAHDRGSGRGARCQDDRCCHAACLRTDHRRGGSRNLAGCRADTGVLRVPKLLVTSLRPRRQQACAHSACCAPLPTTARWRRRRMRAGSARFRVRRRKLRAPQGRTDPQLRFLSLGGSARSCPPSDCRRGAGQSERRRRFCFRGPHGGRARDQACPRSA